MDISGPDYGKNQYGTQAESEEQLPTETIGSLTAKCEELTQQIDSERDRLERYMLETGGASDASDRIQKNIESLEEKLTEAEGRLQELFEAQEKEFLAAEKEAAGGNKNAMGRGSVIKELAEKKKEAAMRTPNENEKERKSPGMER